MQVAENLSLIYLFHVYGLHVTNTAWLCNVFFTVASYFQWYIAISHLECNPSHLKLLHKRPTIQFLRKVTPRLGMQIPITVRNRIRVNLPIFHTSIHRPVLRSRNINHPIDDRMRNMHSLGTELSCQTLGRSSQCELAACKGGHVGGAAQGGGRAGDY